MNLLRPFLFVLLFVLPFAGQAQERIVVIGPSLVEIAYALGAGDRIVGIDETATYPPETAEATSIGYFRRVPIEGVLSLDPDTVITTPDAGPREVFPLLEQAGVAVHIGPDVETPESVPEKIRYVGAALGLSEAAERLVAEYEAQLAGLSQTASAPRKALFVMTIQGNNPLVAGADTAPDTMFAAAGFENAAGMFEGYRSVGPEALIALAPEVVVMMPPHAARLGGIEAVMAQPGFQQTPAFAEGRYGTMEGALLMRFGPRTPQAIGDLKTRFGQ